MTNSDQGQDPKGQDPQGQDPQQAQAHALVHDFKARLSPYVKAMKERGYFGEAMKLAAQQQAQNDAANAESQSAQAKQAHQADTPTATSTANAGAQGQMGATTALDPVVSNSGMPSDLNHGIDLPSGDYLSVSKDVQPDSSDQATSRAPDVTAAVRPQPAKGSDGFS